MKSRKEPTARNDDWTRRMFTGIEAEDARVLQRRSEEQVLEVVGEDVDRRSVCRVRQLGPYASREQRLHCARNVKDKSLIH